MQQGPGKYDPSKHDEGNEIIIFPPNVRFLGEIRQQRKLRGKFHFVQVKSEDEISVQKRLYVALLNIPLLPSSQ